MSYVCTGRLRLAATSILDCLFPNRILHRSVVSPRRDRSLARCTALGLLVLLGSGLSWAKIALNFQGLTQTLLTGGITLSAPSDIAVDTAGNVYIGDTSNNQIVTVNPQGVASVLAISGLTPALSLPTGVAVDGAGNLYIADTGNSRVVVVSAAGSGSVVSLGSVTLSAPQGVAVDTSGDIFVADSGNNRIVEVPFGGSAAVLGIAVSSGSATLSAPIGLAVDVSGNLYVADSGNSRVVTVASGGTTGAVLSTTGETLSGPQGVAVDGIGNVFIADTGNNQIVEVDTSGNGLLLGTSGFTLSGAKGIAVNIFGTVYVADTTNNRSLTVDLPVMAALTSGSPGYSLNKSAVGFGHLQLGTANAGNLILTFTIADTPLGAVQVVTAGAQNLDFTPSAPTAPACANAGPEGCINVCVAGTTNQPCTMDIQFLPTAPGLRNGAVVLYDGASPPNVMLTVPLYGFSDSPVAALAPNTAAVVSTGGVILDYPFQLALDGAGNMYTGNYVQTTGNPQVVKIAAGGGSAVAVSTAPVTLGASVTGVAVDGAGNLYIADYYQDRIVVVTPGGVASVLTINGLSPALGEPTELAFDGAGNLYIADYAANARAYSRIVEVSSLEVAGGASSGLGRVINTGSFTFPSSTVTGLTEGPNGTIYIAARTANGSHIVQVTAAGAASEVNPSGLTFSNPQGAFVDAMGNLYVEDAGNTRIVRITTAGVASVIGVAGLPSPSSIASGYGVAADASGNIYIPDWNNGRVVFVNVSGAALTFASTKEGLTSSDSPRTATVTNLGNQALAFSADPTYTLNFSEDAGDTNQCTSTTSLTEGTLCDVAVDFTPQSVGSLSAGITVTNNTLNVAGSTQQLSVSGIGVAPSDNTATAVSASPAMVNVGQALTVTATVVDTAEGHTGIVPTGGVTFMDTLGTTVVSLNGGAAVALSGSGQAVLSGVVLSGAGTHTITASYPGVSNVFVASSNTTTAAVALNVATVAGPVSVPVQVTLGVAGTVPLTVTGSVSAAPTGSVTYNVLDASNASVAAGSATLTVGMTSSTATVPIASTLAEGSYTVSVIYGGDANYAASAAPTAIPLIVDDFNLTIAAGGSTSATASPGGTATYDLTVAPTSGPTFLSAVTLSVSGFPPGATATITPQTLAVGLGSTPVTLTILVPSQTSMLQPGGLDHGNFHRGNLNRGGLLALKLSPFLVGMLFLPWGGTIRRAAGKPGATLRLLLLFLLGTGLAGLAACGTPSSGFFGQVPQTYTVTVTAMSGVQSHSTTLTLTVK